MDGAPYDLRLQDDDLVATVLYLLTVWPIRYTDASTMTSTTRATLATEERFMTPPGCRYRLGELETVTCSTGQRAGPLMLLFDEELAGYRYGFQAKSDRL